MPLGKSKIIWKDGVPVASAFDDPYYSVDGGLAESRFVFLDGSNFDEKISTHDKLVIAETGFGTGLNFLATWQRWQEQRQKARVIFISAEAYPMSCQDMEQAHSAFPELALLSKELRAAWPPPSPGFHYRQFENGAVGLLLMFGDAARSFARLNARVDAWYLDGFAPAKNPEMWTDALFTQIGRLSSPGTTLATFTAAGFVRRGLSAHGFQMKKTPGFGRKRERLVGHYIDDQTSKAPPVWATTPPSPGKHAVILGHGIAGASMAYSLHSRGYRTTLVANPAQLHTSAGLSAAVTIPRFLLGDAVEREFFNSSYAYCVTHRVMCSGFSAPLGARILAKSTDEHDRFTKIASQYEWPSDWMSLTGDGLSLPRSGTLSPDQVLEQLGHGTDQISAYVEKLERADNQWSIIGRNNETLVTADIVILAAGIHTGTILEDSGLIPDFAAGYPVLWPNAGQVEILRGDALAGLPPDTLAFGGYLSTSMGTPADRWRIAGSTFDRLTELPDDSITPTKNNRRTILQQMESLMGVQLLKQQDEIQSWSGVRATVPDHLPYAGPVPDWHDTQSVCATLARDANIPLARAPKTVDGLYMLTGLGSKGYQYAPLLAEYVAAMISDDPLPLPTDLVPKLHPARSFIGSIKRRIQ